MKTGNTWKIKNKSHEPKMLIFNGEDLDEWIFRAERYFTTDLLLKRDRFHWNANAKATFHQLKIAMTEVPVLALQDFSQEFVIETDASGHGLWVILMPNQHPIAYFSHVLPQNA